MTVNQNKSDVPNPSSLTQKKRLRETELLLDISRKMSGADSLNAVLSILIERTAEELGAERGTLFLNDKKTGEPRTGAGSVGTYGA